MNKRYQVFVSSTYSDLKDERERVIQALMEMDCIPSGMELFPAADEDQWEFIKKVIDDCDYYLLIIGGRYGSTTTVGLSYTEQEYHYAIEKGLKVVAFLHQDPDGIVVAKTDKNAVLAERLSFFRKKVEENRLVRYWNTADQLPGLVSMSLNKTIRIYPAVGWVRANTVGSTELLSEINSLRKENEELRIKISTQENRPEQLVENIADMAETVQIRGDYQQSQGALRLTWETKRTWNQIFALLSPYLLEHPHDRLVKRKLSQLLLDDHLNRRDPNLKYYDSEINDQDFQTIKVQLKAYGLINLHFSATKEGDMALFWALTERGEGAMVMVRAVRKAS